MPHLPETLYSSSTLDVIAYKQEASANPKPLVVISFQPRGSLAAKEPWGAKFLLEAGYAVVGIQPKQNHWYQPLLQADVRSAIRSAIDAYFPDDYSRLTYGSSMGAYAALRFAADLGATKAFALSPPARTKVWAKWQNDVETEIDPVSADSVLPDSHVLIAYDPTLTRPRLGPPDAIDARDFRSALIKRCTVDMLECPNFGHPVTNGLAARGLLKSIFLALADESRFQRPDLNNDTDLGHKEFRTRVRNLLLSNQAPKAVDLVLKNRALILRHKKAGRIALLALRKVGHLGPLKQELIQKFDTATEQTGASTAIKAPARPRRKKQQSSEAKTQDKAPVSEVSKPSRLQPMDKAQLRTEMRATRKAARRAARIANKQAPNPAAAQNSEGRLEQTDSRPK